jgi:PRTRC genetic system protein A
MINYHVTRTIPLPLHTADSIEYCIARNGIFARASRPGLDVLIPVSSYDQPLKELVDLYPEVQLTPLVPIALFERIHAIAWHNLPNEVLFHLVLADSQWELIVPDQKQSQTQCQPHETGAESSTHQALIEIHSHGTLPAYFSSTDDADECSGFRIYGVIGAVHQGTPELILRVGLFGHAYLVSDSLVFDQPTNARIVTPGSTYYAMEGSNDQT